ncbi:MAG: adenine phosphoribosyltransferase [Acidobacteriota bacterium]|nr:adenine phosphoribosyltransferase [Acidobacteriota bacterium]
MSSFDYESLVVDIPDYPEPGVIFKDVTPLIGDPQGFAAAIDAISGHFMGKGITKVIGAEARGFFVGAPVAYRLGCGFVPARKPGKLPRDVYAESYALEYGTDELQVHQDALVGGDRVLVVDDLVATGGTAVACAKIAEHAGATFCGFAFLMELAFLNPREVISRDFSQEIFSLFKVE